MKGKLTALVTVALLVAATVPTAPAHATGVWSPQASGTSGSLYCVEMVDASEGWAAGQGGTLIHYVSGVWAPVSDATTRTITGIEMLDASEGWAVGLSGTIFHYAGGTWSFEPPGMPGDLWDVSMVSATEGWAVGQSGLALHYDGVSWTPHTLGSMWLQGVDAVSASDVWAVGSSGAVQHYDGISWTPQLSGTPNTLADVYMLDAGEGWAVGANGAIIHFSGGSWSTQPSGTLEDLLGVHMLSASEGWAVGRSGTVLHYDGMAWSPQTSGTAEDLVGVSIADASDGWAVGPAGTVVHYGSVDNGVSVTASAPAPTELSLTFSVTASWTPDGGSISNSSIDFGTLEPNAPKWAGHRLQVSTNASNGYSVTAAEDGPLTSGAHSIPDVTGDADDISETVAGEWDNATTYGFGYSLGNVPYEGDAAAFTDGFRQFADVSAGEAAQEIMSSPEAVVADKIETIYKLNIGPAQQEGSYTNTVTFIATGNL